MPAFTSFLNLYKPGGGSSGLILPDEVADIDRLNQNSDLIDAWAVKVGNETNRSTRYYGTAAAMGGALVPPPKEGDTYQESDGNKILWKRVGGAWVTNEGGLYLIRPTSVVNAAIAADGGVEPTGTPTSISLNDIFSTRFRKCVVEFNVQGAAMTSLQLKLRRAGADVGADYVQQRNYAAGSGTTAAQGGGGLTGIDLTPAAATHITGRITINNPARNVAKSFHGECFYFSSPNAGAQEITGYNAVAGLAPVDGISLAVTGTTFVAGGDSFVKVYGLA